MSSAAHERYRKRLAALAADCTVMGAIEGEGARCAWWQPCRDWRRVFGRFNPDSDAYASLVFETEGEPQSLLHVEVYESLAPLQRALSQTAPCLVAFHDDLGWLHVEPFPSDAALETLNAVLGLAVSARVVRYRPQRRCTIRVEEDGRARFVKVYPKKFLRHNRGEQLHAANMALWQAAERGRLEFAVARPERWDALMRSLWQEELEGAPAFARLFGPDGEVLAGRMGRAAASLTLSGVRPQKIFGAREQLAASCRYGAELSVRVPRLAAAVCSLLETLEEIHAASDARPLRPIHGDMDAHQWLYDGRRLGLVDFDDFALGDPELDVATFLAELEFEERPSPPLLVEQLAAVFVGGYESVVGALDQRLLCAYLAHKRLFKALRSARSLRRDGDLRAERHLLRACQSSVGASNVFTTGETISV